MPKRAEPSSPTPVTVEVGGKPFSGHYTINGKVITVYTAAGRKTTQIGGTPVTVLAEMLLRELCREGKA